LTKNPRSGLFGGDDNVETAPFQPFGKNKALTIYPAPNGKPTSAIYSASTAGGDLKVHAYGLHYPRGLAFDVLESGAALLYATNDGMELRGSRPVKDDPDVLYTVYEGQNYGWPDYSADLAPITDERFRPDPGIMDRTSYPKLGALVAASRDMNLVRGTLVSGVLPSLAGAAKLTFVPRKPEFRPYEGRALVALWGDRAPYATSGQKLRAPTGYKIVSINIESNSKVPEDFIRNTQGKPASMLGRNVVALERPIDVKFGPDGRLYVLDYGRMEMRGSREKITAGTGRVFVLEPAPSEP
jgi:glucose/arabinose dehydrogenase